MHLDNLKQDMKDIFGGEKIIDTWQWTFDVYGLYRGFERAFC